MALIALLSRILSDNLPPFSALLFLLITALPAYHLVILPIYYSSKSHLSAFPGPTLTLLTPHYTTLLDALHLRTKTLYRWHLKYGPVVRVGPNEVSFTSTTAIKQIYQDPTMEKDSRLYGLFTHFGANNAFTSRTSNEHGWRRKGVTATLSWSKVLEKEGVEMWIGKVVGRYLRNIEEDGMASKAAQDGTGRHLVDVYLLNNWFATDVVTGVVFGAKRGTKTLLPDSHSNGEGEKWWQKPAYHRRMVKEHYASTFRAHTYLYVEFPTFMRIVDKLIKIGDIVIKKLSVLAGASNYTTKGEPDVFGRRIDDWGWKTWMSVKDSHVSGVDETCVAGVLAGLATETGESFKNVKLGDEKQQRPAWSDEVAASELMDQMLAGMDTTSDTLSFLLYHLSLPSSSLIQSNLHNELVTAFPPTSGWDQLPPFFDDAFHWNSLDVQPNYLEFLQTINTLPYLDAVVKETLRLYTALPGTLPRIVPNTAGRGKIIDGLYIQPGTVVGSFAYGIHRDLSVFVESHRFRPERWIVPNPHETKEGHGNDSEEDFNEKREGRAALTDATKALMTNESSVLGGQDGRMHVKAMEKRLWAFGSGGRGCVGRHLATLEMKMLVATIYWRYKTETVAAKEAQIFGKLDHSHWDHRKTFRDVLPFKGVNGVLAFIPYAHNT